MRRDSQEHKVRFHGSRSAIDHAIALVNDCIERCDKISNVVENNPKRTFEIASSSEDEEWSKTNSCVSLKISPFEAEGDDETDEFDSESEQKLRFLQNEDWS